MSVALRELTEDDEEFIEEAASGVEPAVVAAIEAVEGRLDQDPQTPDDNPVPHDLSWWAAEDVAWSWEPSTDTTELSITAGSEQFGNEDREWRTFYSRIRSQGRVLHFLQPEVDMWRGLQPINSKYLVRQRLVQVDDTNLVVSLRDFVQTTLADYVLRPTDNMDLGRRLSVLSDVLQGLDQLHRNDVVHGDLRPENIALAGDRALLFDYAIRPPLSRLTSVQMVYVAPEARYGHPTMQSDVFAFGKLAQRLLGSYLWDNRRLPIGLRTSEMEWILDFCTVANPAERPTIQQLREVLFGDQRFGALRPRVKKSLAAARGVIIGEARSGYRGLEFRDQALISGAAGLIEAEAKSHLETQLALYSEPRVSRLLTQIALDTVHADAHSKARNATIKHEPAVDYLEEPTPELDAIWRDRVHRIHFGRPLPIEGENRRLKQRDWAAYDEHIRKSAVARLALLSRDRYYYTAGVVKILSRDVEVVPADVAVRRQWGSLLAVQDHGRWLYPAFQFDETGRPIAEIAQANELLGEEDRWDVLSWWHLPVRQLGGKALAETITTEPGQAAFRDALELIGE